MINPSNATHVYVGRKPCGCIDCAATDLGDKWTGDSVRDFIKSGRAVERLSLEQYRGATFGCKCNKLPVQASLLEEAAAPANGSPTTTGDDPRRDA